MSLRKVELPESARLAALAERLKGVQRYNKVLGGKRRENSAEHSWHAALTALVLAGWSDAAIDPFRAASLLVVHDLIEILAGDANPFSAAESGMQAARERAAARVLFARGSAPRHVRALWEEFRAGRTAEARFARAIDKFMPMLLSVIDPKSVNRRVTFTREQYVAEKRIIAEGSRRLWKLALEIIDRMGEAGHFLEAPAEAPARRARKRPPAAVRRRK